MHSVSIITIPAHAFEFVYFLRLLVGCRNGVIKLSVIYHVWQKKPFSQSQFLLLRQQFSILT